jgi:RNA polymerase sigma factor (sigma-70 family)
VSASIGSVLRYLCRAGARRPAGAATDAALLQRFAAGRDGAAFEELLLRHGPMVLGTVRRVLNHEADAEEAFQATFLVLARRAAGLGRVALGPWLHGVARRTAAHARAARARRQARERRAAVMAAVEPSDEAVWRDLRPALDEEVGRLPARYRAAVVLCYLEGKTYEEAAALLGCPKGTLAARLSRARERLRGRLVGRGVVLSAAALGVALAEAPAAVPAPLRTATLRAALPSAAVPAGAEALAREVMHAMRVAKVKVTAAVALGLCLAAVGAGTLAVRGAAGRQAPPTPPAPERAADAPQPKKPAEEQAAVPPLKKYRVGVGEIEAGFVPTKTEVVLGEPLTAALVIKNPTGKPFEYFVGGDYRLTGRHERFQVQAVDAAGRALADPLEERLKRGGPGGGLGGMHRAPPGGKAEEPLDLAQYRTFDKPGTYTVTCRFGLAESFTDKVAATVETTFRLKVLPPTPENVKRIAAELVRRAQAGRGDELKSALATLCAVLKEGAVPELAATLERGDAEHRAAAAAALGPLPGPAATAALLKALRDPEEPVRATAAGALGDRKTEEAAEVLLARVPQETRAVLRAVLPALGRTRSPRAFPQLERALGHADATVRRAAVSGLAEFGGERALTVLRRCAEDDDIGRREAVVRALAEKFNQPVRVEWLLPLLRASHGSPSPGPTPSEAMFLLRAYGGERAPYAAVLCLDFDDPAPTHFYNYCILVMLRDTRGAPAVTWQFDADGQEKPGQREANRKALAQLRTWLAGQEKARGPETERVRQLVRDLASEDFGKREKAARALEAEGKAALEALLRAAALSEDAEVRHRAARVVAALERRWQAQWR